MRYLTLPLAAVAILLGSVRASAQFTYGRPYAPSYCPLSTPDVYGPDLGALDTYADQLAEVARHLHEDAHQLSQDFVRAPVIETYVATLEQLQQHIHEILHAEVEFGVQQSDVIGHVMRDMRQVKSLVHRLAHELHHQRFDGACVEDLRLTAHMRQVIYQEALPLVRQIEFELYGNGAGYDRYPCPFSQPIHSPTRHRIGYFGHR